MDIEEIAGTRLAIIMLCVTLVVLLLPRWRPRRHVGPNLAIAAFALGAPSIAGHAGFQEPYVFGISCGATIVMVGLAWFVHSNEADPRLPSVSPRFVGLSSALAGIIGVGLAISAEFDGSRIVILGLMAADFALVVSLALPDAPDDDR